MKNEAVVNSRAGERGAISIKTLFMFLVAATGVFLVIKIAPVYIEQKKVSYAVDELARVAAVRGWKEDKINQDIKRLSGEYDLPDGSINFTARERNVQIVVGYHRDIDLLVTTYTWQVSYTTIGREI